MNSKKPILLIEDDHVDIKTVKRAMQDIKVTNQLDVVFNGEEALTYLNQANEFPCLILLDLNMPKMNGIEFLKEVRSRNMIPECPIVVLTTSTDDEDRVESFGLHVAGYMVKPVVYQRFVETLKTIDIYWTLSLLP